MLSKHLQWGSFQLNRIQLRIFRGAAGVSLCAAMMAALGCKSASDSQKAQPVQTTQATSAPTATKDSAQESTKQLGAQAVTVQIEKPKTLKKLEDKIAPETGIQIEFEPGEITAFCETALVDLDFAIKKIENLKPAERKVENTLFALERALGNVQEAIDSKTPIATHFLGDEALSREASECEARMKTKLEEIFLRRPLYLSIVGVKPPAKDIQGTILWKKYVRGFEREGASLSDKERAKVLALKKQIIDLESEFDRNLNMFDEKFTATEEELKGCALENFASFKKVVGSSITYELPVKATFMAAVMTTADSSLTRKRARTVYLSVLDGKNGPLLVKTTELRREVAQLLGFKSWADYIVSDRMAGSRSNVIQFLDSLAKDIEVAFKKDRVLLQAEKDRILKAQGMPSEPLQLWDVNYLMEKFKARNLNVDREAVRQFFPVDKVIQGVQKLYAEVLGLKIETVANPKVWHPKVQLLKVSDLKNGNVLGYVYLDLYQRPRKYSHAAMVPLRMHQTRSLEKPNPTVAILVTNFQESNDGSVPKLYLDDVNTTLHEFGHVIHGMVSKAEFLQLGMNATKWDFVEAPSQMAEEWLYHKDAISILSDTNESGKRIDEELLKRLQQADKLFSGYVFARQMSLAQFDQAFHGPDAPKDVANLYRQIGRKYVGMDEVEGAQFLGSFGHLMRGYSAGYYGYMWSLVVAQDMFDQFKKSPEGVMSPTVGKRYRELVLEQGDLESPAVSVKKFLGRPFDKKAFLDHYGWKKSSYGELQ